MKSFLQFLLFVLVITLVLAGLYAWKSGRFETVEETPSTALDFLPKVKPALGASRVPGLAALDDELGRVAGAVIPSVVSVSARKSPAVDPREDLIRQYFGFGRRQPVAETGSGVIVSEEGHIITNLHVIDGATEVLVTLSDGRSLPGKLLGADPLSDVAILKIDASGLQPLALADSDKVRVGQLVFAVGAPYGLQESVTMGIISARDRLISSESANEYFQTDAPINPGNSGGPLVNIHGEVVAINNSIKTESGGFQGVAFSIPSNTAKRVFQQIVDHGRVLRPYLGVVMLPLNADTARQLGLPDDRGALIDAVFANSPAALAGLRRGDFVVKFDGREVGGYRDLRKRVSEAAVGRETEMEILREGERIKVPVTIVEQAQSNAAVAAPAPALIAPSSVQAGALSGVTVRGLTPQLSAKIGLPDSVEGVLVQSVADGSPAAGVLLPGDVIELVNDTPVTQPEQFAAVAGALAPGERAIVLLSRGRVRAFEVVGP